MTQHYISRECGYSHPTTPPPPPDIGPIIRLQYLFFTPVFVFIIIQDSSKSKTLSEASPAIGAMRDESWLLQVSSVINQLQQHTETLFLRFYFVIYNCNIKGFFLKIFFFVNLRIICLSPLVQRFQKFFQSNLFIVVCILLKNGKYIIK